VRRVHAVAVAALVATVLSPTAPSSAQAPGGRLVFVSQTPWVAASGDFTVRFRIDRPVNPAHLEVHLDVYPAVATRSEFNETLRDRLESAPLPGMAAVPVPSLAPDANGDLSATVRVQTPREPGRAVSLPARDGVYPVRVSLRERGAGPVVDRLVTHLVHLPEAHPGPKLGLNLTVPVHAPPALQPDGSRSLPGRDRLAGLATGLEALRTTPFGLRPTPETVAALVSSTDPAAGPALNALRQVAADRPVYTGTYVPTSAPALLAGGLDGEMAGQLTRATATLTEVLRVRPDARTWVAQEPLDAASLTMLTSRGFDRFVVAEYELVPLPDELLTLTRPFTLAARPHPVPAVVADAGLAAHFDNRANQGLQAAHLLADLAVLYLDEPPLRRAVVAVPPRTWRADRAFLDAVSAGLTANPVVEAVSLETIFSTVPSAETQLDGDPMVRRPAVRPPGSVSEVVTELRPLRQRLDSLGSVLGPGNAVSGRLDERLLVSQSADLDDARQRRAYLSGVDAAIDDELSEIQMPTNRSITLTARRAQIPVTFQNRTGHPVKVVVRMQSDKLDFPAGTEQVLELTRLNTTERFPVVTRTSGAFPIRITLESPDGGLEVGRARLTVRSTAASSVSLGVSLGAVLFLAIWWGRHAMRGRRARRLVPA
jgi:hypothetical protein